MSAPGATGPRLLCRDADRVAPPALEHTSVDHRAVVVRINTGCDPGRARIDILVEAHAFLVEEDGAVPFGRPADS